MRCATTSVSVSDVNCIPSRKVGAQSLVILDDAVVDDRDAVLRYVRMRVARIRNPVGCPAGVCNSHRTCDRRGVEGILQDLHLAHRA
jgi:hypothetical protein